MASSTTIERPVGSEPKGTGRSNAGIPRNRDDTAFATPRERILVVDDKPETLSETIRSLSYHFQVEIATNADEARNLTRRYKLRAALVDVQLQCDTDGIFLAKYLGRIVPTVLCSIPATSEDLVESVGSIVTELPPNVIYVSKRKNVDDFVKTVLAWVNEHKVQDYKRRMVVATLYDARVPLMGLGFLSISLLLVLVSVLAESLAWLLPMIAFLLLATPIIKDGDLISAIGPKQVLVARWREYVPITLLLMAVSSIVVSILSDQFNWFWVGAALGGLSVMSVLLTGNIKHVAAIDPHTGWLNTELWVQQTPLVVLAMTMFTFVFGLVAGVSGSAKLLALAIAATVFLAFSLGLALPLMVESNDEEGIA